MHSDVPYLDLLNKEFKLGGRGPIFYDCWGLCIELGKRVELIYPNNFTPLETSEQDRLLNAGKDEYFTELKKPEPYCIVAFSVTPPFFDHCGFVIEDCKHFIHIMRGRRLAIQRLDNKILNKRLLGYYAINNNNKSVPATK